MIAGLGKVWLLYVNGFVYFKLISEYKQIFLLMKSDMNYG
jgi:hypothetical protein